MDIFISDDFTPPDERVGVYFISYNTNINFPVFTQISLETLIHKIVIAEEKR